MKIASIAISVFAAWTASAHAAAGPSCLSGHPAPTPQAAGAQPEVGIFHDVALDRTAECFPAGPGTAQLAVALSGRFDSDIDLNGLAARVGAVSATVGLVYWSTTRQAWRPLISDAYAVSDAAGRRRRLDFSAAELTSGEPRYFVQNDTQSTGDNLYEMTVRSSGPDRLTVKIVNLSPIRLTFVPLFEARSLISRHRLTRTEDGTWRYYGLSLATAGILPGTEKSLVNRAAALFRHLAGIPPDSEPPLAP